MCIIWLVVIYNGYAATRRGVKVLIFVFGILEIIAFESARVETGSFFPVGNQTHAQTRFLQFF